MKTVCAFCGKTIHIKSQNRKWDYHFCNPSHRQNFFNKIKKWGKFKNDKNSIHTNDC